MFCHVHSNLDFEEFKGDINVGDLIKIKEGMMLVEPILPVMVLEADNTKGIYEIMYTSNNYVICCGRMDIEKVVSENQ